MLFDLRIANVWDKVRSMVTKYGTHYDNGNESWSDYQRRKAELSAKFDQWRPKS